MFFLAFAEVQLVPDGTIFIHIALILLMIWLLNRTFFRPINRVIASREQNKGGRFGEAEEILRGVEEKNARYNAAMLEARSKSYELIEREKAEALARRQAEIGAVKNETEQSVAKEKAELNRQAAEAKTTIARDAEQMAERISSSILKTT
ncbi:MAG: ATP synthase F0 subunit B [Acidobacteriota bacterium]|nr:ATP synthase F0 subunit B [Acidobacteriota bacterium]